jgi:hypothetical protein
MSAPAAGQKIALLHDVIRAVGGAGAVAEPMPPLGAPTDFVALSREAALAAERIAWAAANLVLEPSAAESAPILHSETLRQIARVQRLHGLPPLPPHPVQSVSANASNP